MSRYAEIILQAAFAEALDGKHAEILSYADMAGLAGLHLGAKGESPADFFYESERAMLAQQLDHLRAEALAAELKEGAVKAVEDVYKKHPDLADSVKVLAEEAAGLTSTLKMAKGP